MLNKKIWNFNVIQIRWLLLSAVVIGLDQWTKYSIRRALGLYEVRPIIDHFNLILAHNTGAAFSILAQAGNKGVLFLTAFATVMSVFLLIALLRLSSHQYGLSVAIALILGGALGNLFDRVRYGYVIDFIDFYVAAWHWPAFNIADSAICMGIAMLFFGIYATDIFLSAKKRVIKV